MGNCCKVASSMEWGGEDWSSVTSKHKVFDEDHANGLKNMEKESVKDLLRASSDGNGKVKIMVSKKELAALLGEKDDISARHVSAEQVLVGLINGKHHVNDYHRTWRPVLQSIPEVD
ncbi:hypothetical protein TanjilG_09340 [Lupinus angustifolius]|uniref:Uncharacterized protein n=1 Tax=Lupinus angustifolius TaxID=3871 RepID=A0A4P1RMF6_LUPAN|nr:PREDICTED: uncharacterized protein LOC109344803 [Lupinus angustifolius]OIW13989.1 hypothetical protein TanjilG_09340 [Lupinus angustifolius]